MWSKAVILPPEEVYVFQYPFSDNKRVEYRPQRLIQLIKDGAAMVQGGSATPDGSTEMSENGNSNMRGNLEREIVEEMPEELCEMVRTEGCILMDSGQSSLSRSSNSLSAYAVIFSIHCLRSLRVTAVPQRSHLPSATSSFARPVMHEGHQLTKAFFL